MKNKYPGMLKIPVNDPMDGDVLALSFNTGGQAAYTPYQHIHFYAGIAGSIQPAYQFFFLQVVQLYDYMRREAFFSIFNFPVDHRCEPVHHIELRNQHMLKKYIPIFSRLFP